MLLIGSCLRSLWSETVVEEMRGRHVNQLERFIAVWGLWFTLNVNFCRDQSRPGQSLFSSCKTFGTWAQASGFPPSYLNIKVKPKLVEIEQRKLAVTQMLTLNLTFECGLTHPFKRKHLTTKARSNNSLAVTMATEA